MISVWKSRFAEATEQYVKTELATAEAGHNWDHINRVRSMALHISNFEPVDKEIVELASLLHDIADSKFHNGNENLGPDKAGAFLSGLDLDPKSREHVVEIIRHISFKGGHEGSFYSPELGVVRDADRLDAIGAIGIARTFHFGGFFNRELYNPAIPPNLGMSKEQYKSSTAPTLNHFYEKLFLLKNRLHTDEAKRIAEKRHQLMETFVKQFLEEWNAADFLQPEN